MRSGGSNDSEISAVAPVRRRRHRSKQERRQIAEESLRPGVSVAVIARSHGVNANQVFHWRKLLREGRLDVKPVAGQLMPVRIAEVVEDAPEPARRETGVIQIEVGRVRIRVEGSVDCANLRTVLEQLGQ
jgi:transposase